MPSGNILSDRELGLIQELLDKSRRVVAPIASRPAVEPVQASPDVYVARTPSGGIAAIEGPPGTGSGTGAGFLSGEFDEPQSAVCQVYRLLEDEDTAGWELRATGVERRVFNLSAVAIDGDTWVLIARDKFGFWFVTDAVHSDTITTSPATGTATGPNYTFYVPTFGDRGTDFNISAASSTVTFNLPDASNVNRGAVTTAIQRFGGPKGTSDTFVAESGFIGSGIESVPVGGVDWGSGVWGGVVGTCRLNLFNGTVISYPLGLGSTSGDQSVAELNTQGDISSITHNLHFLVMYRSSLEEAGYWYYAEAISRANETWSPYFYYQIGFDGSSQAIMVLGFTGTESGLNFVGGHLYGGSLTGATTIVTVGTISTGTWEGTEVGVEFGGTGSNLSATGPGVVLQGSIGGALTVSATLGTAYGGFGDDVSGWGAGSTAQSNGSGAFVEQKNNYAAGGPPGVSNDNTEGYIIGSEWYG